MSFPPSLFFANPEAVLDYNELGWNYIAVHKESNTVVFGEKYYDDFEAKLNDLRPSVRKQLFCTHTALWCKTKAAAA